MGRPSPEVRFVLTKSSEEGASSRNTMRFFDRVERVALHLKREAKKRREGEGPILIRDFPWTSEEMACVVALVEHAGLRTFCLGTEQRKDNEEEEEIIEMVDLVDGLAPDWVQFEELLEVDRVRYLRIFNPDARTEDDGQARIPYLPAFIFPRDHPRHDACIPEVLPDRTMLRCLGPKDVRGALHRLGGLLPRFCQGGLNGTLNASLNATALAYQRLPWKNYSRGLLCFEDSHLCGEALFIYFKDQARFSECDVFRHTMAPRSRVLKGSIFDVAFTRDSLVILDVLMVGDSDKRALPNTAARLVCAHGALDVLREMWGDWVYLSEVLMDIRTRPNDETYLVSSMHDHPYVSGPDPKLSLKGVR